MRLNFWTIEFVAVITIVMCVMESLMADQKLFDKSILKNKLTPQQYQCTQENGTEAPFANAYWNNKEPGIYVDVVSGEPLFSSVDKFDSGSGWPSFTQPIQGAQILEQSDHSHGMVRTEVRSKKANSHLGHLFDDGPGPSHQRFCINSASLRFIALDKLVQEGYGQYLFDIVENLTRQSKGPYEVASFAGGCFWGMEELFRQLKGVVDTRVGYTGGQDLGTVNYQNVKTGSTGHAESLEIVFDPKVIGYEELVIKFFKVHDPTTLNSQGNDRGTQYRSALFYFNNQQKEVALAIIERVKKSGFWKNPIVTQIVPASRFYPAEEEHQKYLKKHPNGYTCHYIRPYKF